MLCIGFAPRLRYVIDFDAPVTIFVVLACSAAQLGNWMTSPLPQDCPDVGSAFGSPSLPPPTPLPLSDPLDYTSAYSNMQAQHPDPAAQASTGGGDAATEWTGTDLPQPEPEPEPEPVVSSLQGLQDHIGCGLNAWFFTCYAHSHYDTFSALFVPRLWTWCFGHIDFDEYKVNMIFMLLLGPACESSLGHGGAIAMYFLTATIGGLWTVTVASSAMIGSSALIFAVLLSRVLGDPNALQHSSVPNQSKRDKNALAGPPTTAYKNLPADLVVALLFVFGQSKLAVLELLGEAEDDGITQSGQIFAGICGALCHWFWQKSRGPPLPESAKYRCVYN